MKTLPALQFEDSWGWSVKDIRTAQMGGDRLMKAPEVANRLRVKVQTLAQWRLRGIGPAFIRMGRIVRYAPADIAAWLDKRSR